MRQRLLIAIPLVLALGAFVWGSFQRRSGGVIRNALEAAYQRDFYNLIDQSEMIATGLGKVLAATTPGQQAALLTEIWSRAGQAQDAVAHLPVTRTDLTATRKFYAQMGDYARTLAQDAADGRPLTGEERKRLSGFEDEMARVTRRLHGLRPSLTPPRFRWTDALVRGTAMPRKPEAGGRGAGAGDMQALSEMNERLSRLPSLIYDGPFSDHLEEVKPKGLTGEPIDARRAEEIARRFADLPEGARFETTGRPRPVAGRMPAYSVTLARPGGGERIVIDVSRQGGHVIWMLSSRPVRSTRLDADAALARAREFLNGRGFADMVPIHSLRERNIGVVAFAARADGAVAYPDQVKVSVALDNGQVVGFDATQYLTNHRARRLAPPKLSAEEARSRVEARLAVTGVRLAVIPVAGGREVLAWEVRARRKDATYFIYINAANGKEENILKAVDTPNGRLIL